MIDISGYNALEIPPELEKVVRDAIKQGLNGLKTARGGGRIDRMALRTAAMFALCCVTLLNLSPRFAAAAAELPLLGPLARVLTFREYHCEDEIKYIDAEIPQIDNTGKSELEQRVNLEIQAIMDDYLAQSELRAKEYFDAFVAAGGAPEDFIPLGITMGYDVKHLSEDCVSFTVYHYETRFSAYNTVDYYNLDLESGRYLTLRDWLGEDYREIAAGSIKRTVSSWSQEQRDMLWQDISFEELIDESTDFYINQDGRAVVVFEKYQAAVGAAGALEFEIEPAGEG